MSTNSYINVVNEEGVVTPVRYDRFVQQLFKPDNLKDSFSHAVLGVAGEAGELVDAVKKHVVYGKPLDLENLKEEIGDIRFYLEALCNILDLSDQEILQANANKLALRYKSLTYSGEAAIARADKFQAEEN
jgi:NTP pyrophosphatase (non-canonical NTP hydrolase)